MKALIVGAGNIGLGFLGHLLWKSGQFSIVFIETREDRVSVLNQEKSYAVVTVSNDGFKEEIVKPVRAILSTNKDSVVDAVVDADLILTAVGKQNLVHIAPYLSLGLVERLRRRPRTEMHVIVIACENVYDNTKYLENLILGHLPEKTRSLITDLVSFPCCMVDRIVPTAPKEIADRYSLAVAVEDFYQFVVDGAALKAPFSALEGVEISNNLSAKLEQKLFTLNMLHGIIGYWGHLAGCEFIHEAISDKRIMDLARGALAEVNEIISKRHSVISICEQNYYGENILRRFQNHNLKDPIKRVALQPIRKLGGDERLVKPAKLIIDDGRIPSNIATGIAAALHYKEENDSQSLELVNLIQQKGVEFTLQSVAGLISEHPLAKLLKADYLFKSL